MTEIFLTTLNQILMMLGFMLIGYFMRKKHIGGESVSTVLSALVVLALKKRMTKKRNCL